MNIKEFAATIKAQYPAYASVDDLALVQKVVDQYPVYRDSIDKDDLTALDNLKGLNGQGPVDELLGAGKTALDAADKVGTETKAGVTGISDLVAGNGLAKSVENIHHVEKGEDPTSAAGVIGEALGSQFTPGQIIAQATLGKIAELVGPAVADVVKGWGEKAALNAVGMVRSIADTLNVDLPSLAQFLMKPINLGGKTFAPIVSATSSTATMKTSAKAIQDAAGKNLAAVASAMDDAVNGALAWAEENSETDAKPILELKSLQPAIKELKEKAVGGWEEVEPAVADKFDAIVASLDRYTKKQANGQMATAFSDLSAMKTKLGGLTNFKSQGENQVALQQTYGVIAQALNDAASKVGGDLEATYANANQVYHQVTAVLNALEGKETKFALKDLFAPGAGAFMGFIVGGLPGMLAGMGVGALTDTYGKQAAARTLNAAAPAIGKGLELGLRSLPVVGNALYHGNAVADALNQ